MSRGPHQLTWHLDSQLDQLANEVQAIKETVGSTNNNDNRQPVLQTSSSPSSVTAVATQSGFSTAASERHSDHDDNNNLIVEDAAVDSITAPSLPRALNSQPFTGAEIDQHFSMYASLGRS